MNQLRIHRLRMHVTTLAAAAALTAFGLSACRQDMHDQPKKKPQSESEFFKDHRSARPLVVGTVARGRLDEDDHFYRGKIDGKNAESFPMDEIARQFPGDTGAFLARGRERFNINCSPCHGRVGDGNGAVVQRGMKRPPSLHIERLLEAPPGYFYATIANGFGAMYDFNDRIRPIDRWAIVAYIRALQQSQNATLQDVPPAEREKLAKMSDTPGLEHATPEHGGEHK